MKKIRVLVWLMMCLTAAVLMNGCGVSHKSPEGVVKSLVTYSQKGKENKIKECYGLEKKDTGMDAQIEAAVEYFKAMRAKEIVLTGCDVIRDFGKYTYVYISYKAELGKDRAYPKLDTYFVQKKDKKYYVMSAKEITTEMSSEAEAAFREFMNTDPYKEYMKAYDEFELKNPNFEAELVQKLK